MFVRACACALQSINSESMGHYLAVCHFTFFTYIAYIPVMAKLNFMQAYIAHTTVFKLHKLNLSEETSFNVLFFSYVFQTFD